MTLRRVYVLGIVFLQHYEPSTLHKIIAKNFKVCSVKNGQTDSMQNLGCVTEENIDYWGNDVSRYTSIPDIASCRSTCNSLGAGYFSYIISTGICWCKDSDAGRRQFNNRMSGETCLGEFKLYILNLLINHNFNYYYCN